MTIRIPFYVRWPVTLLFIVVVTELSLEPDATQTGDSYFSWLVVNTAPPVQKMLHVIIYGCLALLWLWTLENVSSQRLRTAAAFALPFGLGIALEWAQVSVPGRFGTLFDVLLNGIGAGGALWLARRYDWPRSG